MANTYSTGTVAVTNGSKTVTITGGLFISINVKPGDQIGIAGGLLNAIDTLTDATHLELVRPWEGATGAGLTYIVWHMPAGWGDRVELNEAVAENIRLLGEGIPFTAEQLAAANAAAADAEASMISASQSEAYAEIAADTATAAIAIVVPARDTVVAKAAAVNVDANRAEVAAGSSYANAKGDVTIPLARARVADGETFIVYAAGANSYTAYRRLTSTTETLLGVYPSATRVANVEASLSSIDVFGRLTGTPGVGISKITNGTYVFATPVPNASDLVTLVGYNDRGSAGTIVVKKFDLASGTLTQNGADASVPVPMGAYSVSVPIAIAAGQYIGIFTGGISAGNTDSLATYSSGGSAPPHSNYWNANGNAASVPTTTLVTNVAIEVRFDLSHLTVTNTRVATVEASAAKADGLSTTLAGFFKKPGIVGRAIADSGTTALTTNVYAFTKTIPALAELRTLRAFNPQSTAGLVKFKQFSVAGNGDYVQVGSDVELTLQPGANTIDVTGLFPIWNFATRFGFHNGAASAGDNANKRLAFTSTTGEEYVVNAASSSNVGSFTPGVPTTANRLEVGVDYLYLAPPATSSNSTADTIDRFEAAYIAARTKNPRNSGQPSALPSLSVSASAPSGSHPAFPSAVTGFDSVKPYCRITGGWTVFSAAKIIPLAITKTIGATRGGGTGQSYQGVHRISYHCTAAVHYFKFQQATVAAMRVIVDGQVVGTAQATAINTDNWLMIDFGSRSFLGRRIEIEFAHGGGATNYSSFMGWHLSPVDDIWASAPSLSLLVFGDSITASQAASYPGDSNARVMGDLMGVDIDQSGLSGSGWLVRPSSGAQANLRDRITDITLSPADAVMIAMGVNDAIREGETHDGVVISAATLQTRVTADLATIKAASPTKPILVFGPYRVASIATRLATYEAVIAAAVAAQNSPFIRFIATIATTRQTGSGSVSAPAGNGNNDLLMSSDLTHPSPDGHLELGAWNARAAMSSLAAMRSELAG